MLKTALFLAGASLALAQPYTISTVAGGAPPATPVAAVNASIGRPNRVATDAAGNLYFSSSNSVFKVASDGTLSLVAGNSRAGFSGDGGAAVNAQLNSPQGIAVDGAGNIYIADSLNNRVRLVAASGVITTFAGTGAISQTSLPGTFNDGGPAVQALLHLPMGVAVDKSGNVYIADTADNLIREVTTDGNITSVAGDGFPSFSGDTEAAIKAELHSPEDVAVDSSGNIYIADTANARIRKITTDGNIATIAGNGNIGSDGDGGAATSAALYAPYGLALDAAGNFYIVENGDSRIRKIDGKGIITTVAGTGTAGSSGSGQATGAQLNSPTGVAVDGSGNLYIADSLNLVVRKIAGGNISTVAGSGKDSYSGDGGPATRAQLNAPLGVAVNNPRFVDFAAGGSPSVYIADSSNNVVRQVASDGSISTFQSGLKGPEGVAVDEAGNVYIADTRNAQVRKVSADGSVTTVAGSGTPGYAGDGGAAASAQLNLPVGVAVDSAGNVYIADFGNNRVRKVDTKGTISTIAGNGSQGYSGDGSAAGNAQLTNPEGVAVDAAGNVYIADTGNNAVRRISTGIIATVAGNGLPGYSGDKGLAVNAQLGNPFGVAVDAAGSIYITDLSSRVRKVYPDGTIDTIAGTGQLGYSGDGGPATSASLNRPAGLAVTASGSVYVADSGNRAVRRLDPTGPGVSVAAVVNGAGNATGPIAPGEVIVIWGSGLGPSALAQYQLTNNHVPTNVAGTSVSINGIPAPVLYTSVNQVGAIVPFGIIGSSAQVTVSYQGRVSPAVAVPIAATAPGLFTLDATGSGQALAIHYPNGSLNGSANPVSAGSYLILYATGAGQTNPPGADGTPGSQPYALPNAKVTATIGGKDAQVGFAGGAQGIVAGVIQVNLLIPAGLPAGPVPVVLKIGDSSTQAGTTIVVSGN